ncbi:MAG: DUF3333 domain-containing protein, partial [Pseudomonadota bacterium]
MTIALLALGWLLFTMLSTGFSVFRQHFLTLEVELKQELIDPDGTRDMAAIRGRDYKPLLFDAINERLPETRDVYDRIARIYQITEATAEESREVASERAAARRKLTDELLQLVERGAAVEKIRDMAVDDTALIGSVEAVLLPASPRLAAYARSGGKTAAGLTERQRRVASGLLRRDRIKLQNDGAALVSVDVDFAGQIIDPRGREREEDIESADFARVLGRSLAPYDIDVAGEFFELEDGAVRAEQNRAAALTA